MNVAHLCIYIYRPIRDKHNDRILQENVLPKGDKRYRDQETRCVGCKTISIAFNGTENQVVVNYVVNVNVRLLLDISYYNAY